MPYICPGIARSGVILARQLGWQGEALSRTLESAEFSVGIRLCRGQPRGQALAHYPAQQRGAQQPPDHPVHRPLQGQRLRPDAWGPEAGAFGSLMATPFPDSKKAPWSRSVQRIRLGDASRGPSTVAHIVVVVPLPNVP